MERAISSCKKYKKEFILGPLFKTLEVIFELFTPFLMKYIINQGIPYAYNDNDYTHILYPGLIIVFLCILGFISTMFCQYFASIATWGVGEDIRNRLYRKINTFSYEDINYFSKSELITIITNDVNKFQDGVSKTIRLLFRGPCIILGSLICSFLINWKIALIYLVIIPLIVIFYFVVFKLSSKQFLKVQKKNSKIVENVNDSLNGIRVIKAFNKENDEISKFKNNTDSCFKEQKKNSFLNALSNPLTFLIINLSIMLIVYFSSITIFKETSDFFITSGDLVALISYLNQILLALIVVCNLVIIFTQAFASNKRINSVLQKENSMINNPKYTYIQKNMGDKIYEFLDVSFSYNNANNYVVKNLNFSINKGETIGIIGETGSGKTTLVRLLSRDFESTSGNILYKGVNLKDYDLNLLKNEISEVSQNNILFKGTIKTNMFLANSSASDEEIIEALKKACAYEFVSKYDDFLDHVVEEGGKNFSGGQKQRLCIARAILKKSEILIFDDSTSALDYLTDRNLRNNIKNIKDKTIIYISQRISTIKDADKIIVLSNGEIIDIGKHDELLSRCNFYINSYNTQVRIK